eukprot:1758650-Rhodomonas_salina.1
MSGRVAALQLKKEAAEANLESPAAFVMGQLDDGLGGVVLTRVVATKLIRIDASILEQGVKRRLVDAAGRVLGD